MNSIDKKNNEIVKLNNIRSSWDYRNYLISNTNEIMIHNKYNSCLNTGIANDVTNGTKGSNPFLFKSTLDPSRPFGYQTSDLKEAFIYKRQGEITKIAPKI